MVIANFTQDEKTKYVEGLDQYDYGQVLRIQGLNLPTAVEIHFGLDETGGTTVTRIGTTKDGVTDVTIPDSMLENNDTDMNYSIYAFVYLADSSSGKTTRRIKIQVKARSKPEAFDRPEDAELFREAIKVVNESAARAEKAGQDARDAATQSGLDAQQTAQDKADVAKMLETVTDISDQVAKVEQYSKDAQDAATKTGLDAKKTAEDRVEVGKMLENVKDVSEQVKNVDEAVKKAQASEQAAAQHLTAVEQIKTNVEQIGNAIPQAVQAGVLAIENAGTAEEQEIMRAGTKAVKDIDLAKTTATDAVETVKTETVQAVQTEGTTQTENVSAEGKKQIKAVADKGQEVLQSIPEDFLVQMATKLDKQQGVENAGKVLVVGEDGNVIPGELQGVGESEEWLKAPVIDIEISEEIAYLYINMIDKKTFCFNEIACEFHLDGITNSSDGRLCFAPKQIDAGWQGIIVANTNGSAGKIQRGFFKIKNSKLVGWHSIYMSSPIANWLDLNSDIGSHIPSESGNPFNKVNNGITEFTIIPYNGKLHPGSRFKIYGRPVKEESL